MKKEEHYEQIKHMFGGKLPCRDFRECLNFHVTKCCGCIRFKKRDMYRNK